MFLSPQLLHLSRDFDETFQLLFSGHENDHNLLRSCSTDFTKVMALLHCFKSKSCLCNSFCSFQWSFGSYLSVIPFVSVKSREPLEPEPKK